MKGISRLLNKKCKRFKHHIRNILQNDIANKYITPPPVPVGIQIIYSDLYREIWEMIFVQSTNERVYVITTSERVEYPLTPPEGSWRKMKIISFFPNGKITNLKKDYNHENS